MIPHMDYMCKNKKNKAMFVGVHISQNTPYIQSTASLMC